MIDSTVNTRDDESGESTRTTITLETLLDNLRKTLNLPSAQDIEDNKAGPPAIHTSPAAVDMARPKAPLSRTKRTKHKRARRWRPLANAAHPIPAATAVAMPLTAHRNGRVPLQSISPNVRRVRLPRDPSSGFGPHAAAAWRENSENFPPEAYAAPPPWW
ncbi:hypothetical protein EJ04DRAFT_564293 [Polyplosphaeria fusca]|uniref:Uncharacterized protein n=1 Tax=Polyplosphaeria fusca TaxID=682080 RepID=A0A9P4R0F3_9PLEO|nr:hypothetical protein EJ04DRAFT_564293 [Polyplosphaeria fusca]